MNKAWAMHLYCSDGDTIAYPLPDDFNAVLTVDVSKSFNGNPEHPHPIDAIRLTENNYTVNTDDNKLILDSLIPRGHYLTLVYFVDTGAS